MKVFLGGTCNNSTWREQLKPMLKIDYFDPVVPDWTPECMEKELFERENCDKCLYVITSQMVGVYSIAEAVDDSNKRPDKTVFCILTDGFDPFQLKSLWQVGRMISQNGGVFFTSLEQVAEFLNVA